MLRLVQSDEGGSLESAGSLIKRLTRNPVSHQSFVLLPHEGRVLARVIGTRSYAPEHLQAIAQEVVRLESLGAHAPAGLDEPAQWVWVRKQLAAYIREAQFTDPPNPQIPSVLSSLTSAAADHWRRGGKSVRLQFLKAVVVAFMHVPRPEPPSLAG